MGRKKKENFEPNFGPEFFKNSLNLST